MKICNSLLVDRVGESPSYPPSSDVSRNSSIEERDGIISQVLLYNHETYLRAYFCSRFDYFERLPIQCLDQLNFIGLMVSSGVGKSSDIWQTTASK